MHFIGLGTAVNVIAIVAGSLLGLALGARMPARAQGAVTDALGLCTLVMAGLSLRPLLGEPLAAAVGGGALVVVLLAVVAGTLFGSWIGLEEGMDDLGRWARRRLGARAGGTGHDESRFVDGFVTSTLVFCVGPMAILGSLADGLGQGPDQLLAKSVLDGFAAIAFASSLGLGVLLSAVAVGLYQGTLTVLGAVLGGLLPAAQVDALTVTGGIVLLGLSVRLLGLKQVRVADMLPALVVAPVLVAVVEAL
ncbi:DUF554 domain-containing protein [Luteococcus sp.]|uniref:DUF554 domain-containing protein n=1 Tax=Luteococcus sp. TaxID=1969402 RepID=UPI0037365971